VFSTQFTLSAAVDHASLANLTAADSHPQAAITGLTTADGPTFDHLHLTIADGTAPLVVTSTTEVANFNAHLLQGHHAVDFAHADAKYIVQELSSDLSAEQSLGALATGILKNTTTAGVGVLSIATGADLTSLMGLISNPPSTGYTIKNIYLNASKHIVVVYDSTPIP
jgi:hypothetical protein